MSDYKKIASEFQILGYQQTSRLSQVQLNEVLDKICRKNIRLHEFDRSISQELFEQASKEGEEKVLIKDYIEVILKAHTLLKKNIAVLQDQLKLKQSQSARNQTLEQLFQFHEDFKLLTIPFGLPAPNKIPELEGYSHESQAIIVTEKSLKSQVMLDKDYESMDLIAVCFITFLWLLLDLLSALVKSNFLNILAALAILGIFILRCFDKHYVRMCIIGIFMSFVFDLIWLLTMSNSFWNPTDPSHRSSKLISLYHMSYILTIVLMAVKLIVFVLIYPYKSNDPELIKIVKFRSWQITLSGKSTRNPLSHLFSKQGEVFGLQ